MNPPTHIFDRQRQGSPAPVSPTRTGEDSYAHGEPPSSASSPVRNLPGGRRYTPLDVQLAEARNEPNETVTVRELDEQIVHERDAGHDDRVALLAEHRVRIMRRRQAEAFPPDDGPGPIAA